MGDPVWIVSATLKAKGFSLSRPPSTYRGPIRIHGNEATVEIEIPDLTFATMPKVWLIDSFRLRAEKLVHVNHDGTICYVGEGGLPLDLYDPGGSVLRVLREAEIALEGSFGSNAAKEYETELAFYWNGDYSVYVALPPDERPRIYHADLLRIGAADRSLDVVVPTGQWKHTNVQVRRQITILSFAEPLRHSAEFASSNLAGVLEWLSSQRRPPEGLREAIVASAATSDPIFVVSPNALIGWKPTLPANIKMLQTAGGRRKKFGEMQIQKSLDKIGLERMTGTKSDLRSVVERNLLGRPSLIGKRISLIGAGTIGGNLARLLVQSGAGCGEDFTIYDTDVFRPGNLGRHVLGFVDLRRSKAEALGDFLRDFHPDVQVRPLKRNALDDWDALQRSDLIIDATGDYNVAAALNHLRMKSKSVGNDVAILHAWVFGNGIAAQTFLNLKDGLGCYRCLRPAFDGPWRYAPVKDVKQQVSLAPAICGEAGYIPFSADAPVAAASLALLAALDWAADKPGQRLRTITLNFDEGKEVRWTSPSRVNGCMACGS
ncbi:MAG: ThiF family adenylyltransferase [Bradyrhizobium sp.]